MPSMLLLPQDVLWKPRSLDEFETVLRSAGLIAAPLPAERSPGFYAGDSFLKLIMFLGCSPRVELKPDADGASACFLQLCASDEVTFFSADRRPAVRCPECRKPLEGIVAGDCDQRFVCPHCSWRGSLNELDWRQAAAFASVAIQVHGIYPHEAVPADALLNCLSDYARTEWKYIYI